MATVDGKKTGGRRPGSVNFRTKVGPKAQEIAERLAVSPFEILLLFAANRWKELGYDQRTRKILSRSGEIIEVDNIEPAERIAAARSATEYLLPKKSSVAFEDPDGIAANSLTQLFKQLADR